MAVKNVTVKISAEVDKSLKEAPNQFNKTNKEVKKLDASVDELKGGVKQLEQALNKATDPRDIKELGKSLKAQKALLKDTTREVDKLAGRGAKGFGKMNKAALRLGATLGVALGARALIRFAVDLKDTALRMEAFERRAKIVFGESIDIVRKFAEENAKSLGLTENQFLGAAAAAGDLLVPLKFTRQRSAEMAVELTKLGGALKQFTGDQRSAAQISQAVSKSLTGEVEALKPLGIQIRLEDKSFRDLVKTKMEDEGVTESQARALAIYQTALDQSSDALRSFEEDTGSLTRQQAELDANLTSITENLAKSFTPLITDATRALNALLVAGQNFDPVGKVFAERLSEAEKFLGRTITEASRSALAFGVVTEEVKDLLKAFKEIKEEDEAIAALLKKQQEESDKSTQTQVRNVAFLREQLKSLNEERGKSATSISRIRQINKEIIPIQEELNKLLGKEKKQKEKLTEIDKLRIQQAKNVEELGKRNIKAQDELAIIEAQRAIDATTTIEERVEKEIALELLRSQQLVESTNATAEEQGVILQEFQDKKTEIEKQGDLDRLANEEEVAAARLELQEAQFEAIGATVSALQNLYAGNAQAQAQLLIFEKILAISKIIINTQVAATTALLPPPVGLGPIAGVPLAAAIRTTGALNIATVAATAVPQFIAISKEGFAEGGYTGEGGKHDVAGVVHKKEFVMDSEPTTKYRDELEAMHEGRFEDFILREYLSQQAMGGVSFDYDDKRLRGSVDTGNDILVAVNNNIVNLRQEYRLSKYRQSRGI